MTWLVKAQDVSWLCVVESVYCVLPSWSRHHGKPLYGEAFILVSWCWSHCRRDVGADKMPDKIIFASMCWIYPYQVPVHSCTILHPMYSIGIQCFPSRNFGLRTVLILKKPRFEDIYLSDSQFGLLKQRYQWVSWKFGWSQQGAMLVMTLPRSHLLWVCSWRRDSKSIRNIVIRMFCYGSYFTSLISPSKGRLPC